MKTDIVYSDQLYKESDSYEEPIIFKFKTKTQNSPSPVAATGCYPARFSHRTLQALWKARVKVSQGPRAWAQVLSLNQPISPKTTDGLRPSGLPRTGDTVSYQLQAGTANPRRNMRDQPRVVASQGEAIGVHRGGCHQPGNHRACRYFFGSYLVSEHAPNGTRGTVSRNLYYGGE